MVAQVPHRAPLALDPAHVDLVAADLEPAGAGEQARPAQRPALPEHGHLAGPEAGTGGEQAQPGDAAPFLHPLGVVDVPAQHLVAAADPEHRRPRLPRAPDGLGEAPGAQPLQVPDRGLGPGQDHQVGPAQLVPARDQTQPHPRLAGERLQLVEVADASQVDHRHVEYGPGGPADQQRQLERVLGRQPDLVEVGHHTQDREPRPALEERHPLGEQGGIAAQAVDDQPHHPPTLGGREQAQGAEQGGEHAPPVHVPDQQHRGPGRLRHPHVDDLAAAQVDLGRAAGPLDDDQVEASPELVQGGADPGPEPCP